MRREDKSVEKDTVGANHYSEREMKLLQPTKWLANGKQAN